MRKYEKYVRKREKVLASTRKCEKVRESEMKFEKVSEKCWNA